MCCVENGSEISKSVLQFLWVSVKAKGEGLRIGPAVVFSPEGLCVFSELLPSCFFPDVQ